MADRLEVDLIVEAIAKGFDKVTGDVKKLDRATDGLGRTGNKQATTLDKMRGAILGIGAVAGTAAVALTAAKKAFELGKEGAQIQKTRDAFDALSTSVGTTSKVILTEMRQATSGMVTDLGLIESANRFLSMGLANTGTEAAKLSEIAVTLGGAMGKEAAPAMEEFALLLANQSIPRLDTFGISAGKVRTRINELKEEFPEMTRETAFMTATLEEAEKSMTRLGDSVPTDEFTKLTVQVDNLKDSFKVLLAKGLTPTIRQLNEGAEILKIYSQAWDDTGGNVSEMVSLMAKAGGVTKDTADAIRIANKALERMRDGSELTAAELVELVAEGERVERGYQHLIAQYEQAESADRRVRDGITRTSAAMQNYVPSADAAAAGTRRLEQAQLDAQAAAQDLQNIVSGGIFDQFISDVGFSKDALFEFTDQEIQAAVETFLLRDKIEDLSAKVKDGEITWWEAIEAAEEYRNTLQFVGDAIDQLPEHKRIEIHLAVTGANPNDLLSGGGTVNPGQILPPEAIPGAGIGGGGGSSTTTTTNPTGSNIPEFQHGGHFVVPSNVGPGGMLMRVHAGEPVSVSPRGSMGTGGSVINIDARGSSPDQVTAAVQRALTSMGQRSQALRVRR